MPSLPHEFVRQPGCRHRAVFGKSTDVHSGQRSVKLYNPNCLGRVTVPYRSVIVAYFRRCQLQPSISLVQTPAHPTIATRWLFYCSCTDDADDLRAAGRGGDVDPFRLLTLLCCLVCALTPLVVFGGEGFVVRRMKIGNTRSIRT